VNGFYFQSVLSEALRTMVAMEGNSRESLEEISSLMESRIERRHT
jgi:hypothetical protein